MKPRILLVDDDEMLLSVTRRLLEDTGRFDVRAESNSSLARQAAREFKPDLMILDVVMPKFDGGDVATMFKDDPQLRDTPIIFLTSMVSKEQVKEQDGKIAGHPFIAKPANLKELLRQIDSCLRR